MNEVLAVSNARRHTSTSTIAVSIHRHCKTAWAQRQKVMSSRFAQAAGCLELPGTRHGLTMMYVSMSVSLIQS